MERYRDLTNAEEKLLLAMAKKIHSIDKKYYGRGSSRVVYLLDPMQNEEHLDYIRDAGLPADGRAYVIKVALGVGGMNQNMREVKAFLEYGFKYPLAHIYRSGKFVEVMEVVDIIDPEYRDSEIYDYGCFEDYYDMLNNVEGAYQEYLSDLDPETEEDNFEFNDSQAYFKKSEVLKVWEISCELADIFGETSDNLQLGYNNQGVLVCYDYGYVIGKSDWHSSCGHLSREELGSYFDLCIEHLDLAENFAAIEEDFMRDLGGDYY